MKRTIVILMLLAIISKVIGFTRDIALSYFFGASAISDIFLISLTVPTILFNFIGTGLSAGYIPMYSRLEKNNGIESANRFTNNLVNLLLVLSTLVLLLGYFFAKPLVQILAAGFTGASLKSAVLFTRISLFSIHFSSLLYIYTSYLELKGNHIIPGLMGFPFNFVTITSIILSYKIHILILPIGSVLAVASQFFLMIFFACKQKYTYRLVLDIKDNNIKKMLYLSLPIILGSSTHQINLLVDRTLASQISTGGISALNYANQLDYFIQGIFVVSITAVIYPLISKMAAENNIAGLKKSITEAINLIDILVIPTMVGAMLFAEPIIRLLFGRGAFDSNAIYLTANALFFYSIGMVGLAHREILTRTFFSMQDTKTPMINATIALSVNIVLNIILSRFMGIGGLALATSISTIFCTILLFIQLRKKMGPLGLKNILITFLRIMAASLIMGAIARLCYHILCGIIHPNLSLIISIGIGAMIYFIIIYLMKIEGIDIIFNRIVKKVCIFKQDNI